MVQNSIIFNPTSLTELRDVIEYLMKFSDAQRIIVNAFRQNCAGDSNSQEEVKKLKRQIEEKENDIANYIMELSRYSEKMEKKEVELRLIQEDYNKLQESLNQKEKDFKNIRDSYEKQLSEKENEIKGLRQQLETFSVSYGADESNTIAYFEINNGHLEETMINKEALYCAKRNGKSYIFGINFDGPIRKACDNPDKYLKPFCEIIRGVEGATNISQEKTGEAELMGTELVVNRKVEICMIKE